MLSFLDGESDGLDWLSFGGLETLLSYGVPLRSLPNSGEAVRALQAALIEAVPERHVAFFRNCLLHYSVGDYVFVHAGVRPGITLEKQTQTDLLWIRDDFLRVRAAAARARGGARPHDLRPAAESRPAHQYRHRRVRERAAHLPGAARQRAPLPVDRRPARRSLMSVPEQGRVALLAVGPAPVREGCEAKADGQDDGA